jgi:hypothetical protein
MPTYFFNLKTPAGTIRDPDGTDLPDELSAREHARLVACELMQHRQLRTRSWRIDLCDSEGRLCLDLLFASVDDSMGHLTPELRRSVEDLCAKSSSLSEMIRALRLTIIEVQGTIARSEGAPYIAAVNGVAVDNKAARIGSAALRNRGLRSEPMPGN